MLKKFLKGAAILIAVVAVITVVAGVIIHEPKPEGKAGPAADALAERMLAAIDYPAWDSTRFVAWTFMGMHHYFWDKQRDLCRVQWGDTEVMLRLNEVKGKAWKGGEALSGKARQRAVDKAWAYFCNDSFWLHAPAKAFDPGTVRRLVDLPGEDSPGLLVQYTSGGVTPGDSYLWILDGEGKPKAWKMWVSVLPIGGLSTSWEAWDTLATGARVATRHQLGPAKVSITDLKGGVALKDMGFTEDPFAPLFP